MNFAKFLRTFFIKNTSERMVLEKMRKRNSLAAAKRLKTLTYLVKFMEELMKDCAKLKYMFRRVLKMKSYKSYNNLSIALMLLISLKIRQCF